MSCIIENTSQHLKKNIKAHLNIKNGLVIEDNKPHKESTILFDEKEQTDE